MAKNGYRERTEHILDSAGQADRTQIKEYGGAAQVYARGGS